MLISDFEYIPFGLVCMVRMFFFKLNFILPIDILFNLLWYPWLPFYSLLIVTVSKMVTTFGFFYILHFRKVVVIELFIDTSLIIYIFCLFPQLVDDLTLINKLLLFCKILLLDLFGTWLDHFFWQLLVHLRRNFEVILAQPITF